jgi:hypothetical protein
MSLLPDNDAMFVKKSDVFPRIALSLGLVALLFLIYFWGIRPTAEPPCPLEFNEVTVIDYRFKSSTLGENFSRITVQTESAPMEYEVTDSDFSIGELMDLAKIDGKVCIMVLQTEPATAILFRVK